MPWSLSPDGTLLAIGGVGSVGSVTRYGAEDLRPLPVQPPQTPLGRVERIAFSADGKLLAAGGDSGWLGVFTVPDCVSGSR